MTSLASAKWLSNGESSWFLLVHMVHEVTTMVVSKHRLTTSFASAKWLSNGVCCKVAKLLFWHSGLTPPIELLQKGSLDRGDQTQSDSRCLFVSTFSTQKTHFRKSKYPKPIWCVIKCNFLIKSYVLGQGWERANHKRALRSILENIHAHWSTIRWTLWEITKLSFNKSYSCPQFSCLFLIHLISSLCSTLSVLLQTQHRGGATLFSGGSFEPPDFKKKKKKNYIYNIYIF